MNDPVPKNNTESAFATFYPSSHISMFIS